MRHGKQRALVICPGRGTYNKEELGYLHRYHQERLGILTEIDKQRSELNQPTVSALDAAENYNLKQHSAGENASSIIYACAKADFMQINRERFEIAAITGNSMGWYITCAVADSLSPGYGAHLINTMGSMMVDGLIGGQSIYPIVDDDWVASPILEKHVSEAIAAINRIEGCELYVSIRLGGYVVFGGNDKALKLLPEYLPNINDTYPMRLFNHAAFHTPLLDGIAKKAQSLMQSDIFAKPTIPMVDGRGNIWQPYSCNEKALHRYTLGTQVKDVYDYSKAIEVSIKEFAPDKIIILGPGATLGGATAQVLIKHNWYDLHSKADFIQRQKTDPVILSMGMPGQRELVI